ncbi:WAT1-related protein At1g09380-like [Phragmites australis]|uniref:WAT1-related protein At1g09380-like n=1 Tax=Phragmites australis TaxID=29695 RepID=UPI002D7A3201|nr:WAT1-related protein At1g09380-like [Phragmites australis]
MAAMGTDCLPAIAMVLVQLGFAGMNVVSKLALDTGMSPYVLIAYRNLIAAAFIAPIAFLLERRSGVKITKKVLIQIFFSSIFGATLNQVLYFVGLKSTTPTIGCALTNTLPALTFVMAAALKMETVRPATPAGQAKVVGTVVCVGGSMIMPFYKGPLLRLWDSPIHWRFAESTSAAAAPAAAGHSAAVIGDVLIIASCVAWAIWFIIQTKMSEGFSAPYTSTAIMSLMAGVQCAGVSAAMDRSLEVWKLGFDIRLYSVLYIGIVGSGIAFALMSWCIQVRGPLFVSMFSPLLLVVVAIVGWAILGEKIHVGSAIGSVLIVAGLYMVLWGKGREMDRHDDGDEETAIDMASNGKGAVASNRDAMGLPVSFSTTAKPHATTRNGNN